MQPEKCGLVPGTRALHQSRASRIYIESGVRDVFFEKFAQTVSLLKFGKGLEKRRVPGP
jgi:acyl-CoA reductase-like NAD-dependent aldehyde dehydrogenase